MSDVNKFFRNYNNNRKPAHDIANSKKNMKIQQTWKILSVKSLQNLKSLQNRNLKL